MVMVVQAIDLAQARLYLVAANPNFHSDVNVIVEDRGDDYEFFSISRPREDLTIVAYDAALGRVTAMSSPYLDHLSDATDIIKSHLKGEPVGQ